LCITLVIKKLYYDAARSTNHQDKCVHLTRNIFCDKPAFTSLWFRCSMDQQRNVIISEPYVTASSPCAYCKLSLIKKHQNGTLYSILLRFISFGPPSRTSINKWFLSSVFHYVGLLSIIMCIYFLFRVFFFAPCIVL